MSLQAQHVRDGGGEEKGEGGEEEEEGWEEGWGRKASRISHAMEYNSTQCSCHPSAQSAIH